MFTTTIRLATVTHARVPLIRFLGPRKALPAGNIVERNFCHHFLWRRNLGFLLSFRREKSPGGFRHQCFILAVGNLFSWTMASSPHRRAYFTTYCREEVLERFGGRGERMIERQETLSLGKTDKHGSSSIRKSARKCLCAPSAFLVKE